MRGVLHLQTSPFKFAAQWNLWCIIDDNCSENRVCIEIETKVKFVHPVSPGGSVKFVASGVNFSIFTNFLCFFLLKLLKLGEIGGVKFLT